MKNKPNNKVEEIESLRKKFALFFYNANCPQSYSKEEIEKHEKNVDYLMSLVIQEIESISHLIHESQKCQNRNGLFYCGECEQPYEECSCSARNSGARKMKQVILQALKNN